MSTAIAATPVARRPERTGAPLGRLLTGELRWIFRRPRTLVVLGLLALAPVAVGISAAAVGNAAASGEGPPLFSVMGGNGFILAIGSLLIGSTFLLPLVVTMSAADALAGESANGTLRGLLLAPVGRLRLLGIKAFGVACMAVAAAAITALAGLLTGLVISGTDGLVTLSGSTLSLLDTLGTLGLAVAWVALQLYAFGAIALAISACTEHPMLVLAGVFAGNILFGILGSLPALSWLDPFLITESWAALPDLLRDPIPAEALTEGALRAACYIVIGLSLAGARMLTKDG
ncbi:ABC-2 type transport system permease protein [Tamaricihabitans halophyticus]|uniref:ABC-2 type transport system permease protein n=1 Tax=Tamaricihabitans halophyticus TaxID=1262583 RepID=A0A4R2R3Q4_9PSEU|nr:ABC transporter permease [Tamaricihabitans halophyticus]TCP56258.1 ABC-2 type transport system permease protein [Tamaricihabitans halophyticus]